MEDTLHRVSQVCEFVRDIFHKTVASGLKLLLPGVREERTNREDRLGKGDDMKDREMRSASKWLMRQELNCPSGIKRMFNWKKNVLERANGRLDEEHGARGVRDDPV